MEGLVMWNMKVLPLIVLPVIIKVMVNDKAFVHETDVDAKARAMTLAPRTYVLARQN